MTEFWLWLGDVFTESFKILPPLGNIPNYSFIAIGIVLFVYWMLQLNKFRKNDAIE